MQIVRTFIEIVREERWIHFPTSCRCSIYPCLKTTDSIHHRYDAWHSRIQDLHYRLIRDRRPE